MKYFIVSLIILFVSGSVLPCIVYAEVSVHTTMSAQKIVDDQDNAKDTSDDYAEQPQSKQPKAKKTPKNKGEDSVFSDYPKSFVIPKGVCETKEPVMTIER